MRAWLAAPLTVHVLALRTAGPEAASFSCASSLRSFLCPPAPFTTRSRTIVSPPQTAAEPDQSTHITACNVDWVDISEPFFVGGSHECTATPSFEQCSCNDVATVAMVLPLSQMAEEGFCFLSEVWDTRRHFSGELSERRCSDSMEGYSCMGQSGKLEPDKGLATTIPFSADEGQRQGQRYAQTSQATQGRQGQACGGGCATGSDSGRSTSPSCRSSPCSTCCQSFKYRSATYGGTATPGHITGHIMAGKRDVAAEHRAVTRRPRTPRHSSALEGSASGCHATGQGQKRALPGQSGKTKFFLVMGLLYRQNHGCAREAIPGAAAGHRKLCRCRSQMGGAVARGFCYIGSSVRRLTGYTFGFGGDGCLGLKGQGRRRSLANRRGYQRSPTTTHGADTGFTSSSDLTRASSPGKVKDSAPQPQGLRGKGGQDAERGGGSGQRFNGCSAPQVGSRSCLKREYEPDAFVRVQQWTHSIVSWHNFVGPFEAEALGLTQAFCQELIALGLPAHCGLEDGRVESEETDVNAGRWTASDLGIRGEYPQRSSLADMDSTSQFEQDLSVGNLSVPQIRASPSPAMSHEAVDRSERGFGCMYIPRLPCAHLVGPVRPMPPSPSLLGCRSGFPSMANLDYVRRMSS